MTKPVGSSRVRKAQCGNLTAGLHVLSQPGVDQRLVGHITPVGSCRNHLAQYFRMPRNDPEQGFCRARGLAAALFPLLKRSG